MITKPAMVEMAKKVQAAAAKAKVEPTFFEAMTAMAFKHFADEAVDIAVVEVGLGGRLDSTNVLTPLVTVVTTIDFDHTRILGDTLPKIAREKAGIFKRGVPAIVFDAQPEVNKTFIEVAEKVGAELKIVNKDIEFSSRFCTSPELGPHTRVCYYTKQSRIEHLPVPLPGEHQATNCGLALAAVECVRAAGFDCPEHLVTGGWQRQRSWVAWISSAIGRESWSMARTILPVSMRSCDASALMCRMTAWCASLVAAKTKMLARCLID